MGRDSEKGSDASPEGSLTWEYLTTAISATNAFCLGCNHGWNSPSLAELMAPNSRIPMSPDEASTVAAAVTTGMTIAPVLSIFVVDRIGKRKSLLAAAVPMTIAWVMTMVARHVTVLIVARFIAGFGTGLSMCTAPMYVGEILSTRIRGSMSIVTMSAFGCGMLFMFVTGPYLGVQLTSGICLGLTTASMAGLWFAPESPYFLVMAGRGEEAEAALEKLRGRTDVAEELELIRATVREKGKAPGKSDGTGPEVASGKRSTLRQLFTIRGNLKGLLLGIMIISLPHLCGFTTTMTYCHLILQAMGSGLPVYWASVLLSIVQVVCSLSVALGIDRIGRRPLILTSGVATGLVLLVIATCFVLMEHTDAKVKQYGIIPMGATFLLILALSIGILTIPPIMTAEIFSSEVKMLASCIVGIVSGLVATVITKSYLVVAVSWGLGHSVPFFGYAILSFFCTVCIAFWLPETKGKTLLEIQRELNA